VVSYSCVGIKKNVWDFTVIQKAPDNLNNKETPGSEACLLCEDLLKQMQRFFDMLQSARKSHDSDWLTVEEIAEELKISKNVVYRLIRNGELETVNVVGTDGHIPQRGHYRIKRSSLNKYLEAKIVKPIPDEPIRISRPRQFPKVKNHLGL
jgi:excisionase family DNA binding protein